MSEDTDNTETIENTEETDTEKLVPKVDPALCVKYLNELLEADSDCIKTLLETRVPCNEKLMNHESVTAICDSDSDGNPVNPRVGLLGVINGLLGVGQDGWHYIAAEIDEDGNLHRFLETPQAVQKDDDEE
jgi:hypothetical protein